MTEPLEDLLEPISKLDCGTDRHFNLSIILDTLIVKVRAMDLHQAARPSDADLIFVREFCSDLLPDLGLYSFFSMTSRKI